MRAVAYTIKMDSAKMWGVWRGDTHLSDRMTLARAITEAGRMAREHHARTGLPVAVDLNVAGDTSTLKRYAKPLHCIGESAAA